MIRQERVQPAVAAKVTVSAAVRLYQVRSGDSISAVAVRKCDGKAADWTGIYAASRAQHLTPENADLINAGQELALDCRYVPASLKYATTAVRAAVLTSVNVTPLVKTHRSDRFDGQHGQCGDGDGDGMDAPCSVIFPQHQQVRAANRVTLHAASGSGSFGSVNPGSFSGMERCIINAESGGNSQVMNASGHYGLFQFSASTWAGHGGSSADFGHASVPEQLAVFAQTVRDDGYSDWTPYDGC